LGQREKAGTKNFKDLLRKTVNENYGNIFLFEELAKSIGLYDVLKSCYPNDYKEIPALLHYEMDSQAQNYEFHYWYDEHYLNGTKKLYTSEVLALHKNLGIDEKSIELFIKQWLKNLKIKCLTLNSLQKYVI
jgi:hypothetical protein